jgi:hypothetical protein
MTLSGTNALVQKCAPRVITIFLTRAQTLEQMLTSAGPNLPEDLLELSREISKVPVER